MSRSNRLNSNFQLRLQTRLQWVIEPLDFLQSGLFFSRELENRNKAIVCVCVMTLRVILLFAPALHRPHTNLFLCSFSAADLQAVACFIYEQEQARCDERGLPLRDYGDVINRSREEDIAWKDAHLFPKNHYKTKSWGRRMFFFLSSLPVHICKPLLKWWATLQQSVSSLLMHLSSTSLHVLQRRKEHLWNLAVCDSVRQDWQSLWYFHHQNHHLKHHLLHLTPCFSGYLTHFHLYVSPHLSNV